MLENGSFGYLLVDNDGLIKKCDENLARMLKTNVNMIENHYFHKFIYFDDRDKFYLIEERYQSKIFDLRLLDNNNNVKQVLLDCKIDPNENLISITVKIKK